MTRRQEILAALDQAGGRLPLRALPADGGALHVYQESGYVTWQRRGRGAGVYLTDAGAAELERLEGHGGTYRSPYPNPREEIPV